MRLGTLEIINDEHQQKYPRTERTSTPGAPMTLQELAWALGGDVYGRQVLAPGPGHSPRDRSLSVWLTNDADGFRIHSHAGDDWRLCRDCVRAKLGLPVWRPGDGQDRRVHPEQVRKFDRAVLDAEAAERRRSEDDLLRIKRARAIWDGAVDPRGTLAEHYLRRHRMLDLPDDLAGPVLRFHPGAPWRDENAGQTVFIPALIALFRSVDDDSITAVHRIALNAGGNKAGRRMIGLVHRSAIKLAAPTDRLVIGEGVETCMAAQQLGHKPAWALGSVGAISGFPVLADVQCLDVLAETGTASEEAVRICADRWHRAGKRVRVIHPDDGCDDLNTELMMKARAP